MPVRDKDLDLVKSLYEGIEFNLSNRRVTQIDIEGLVVMYDDPEQNQGLAVIKDGKTDKLCFVMRNDNQYRDKNGQIVIFRGWVHAILRPVSTAIQAEYAPRPNEKTSM